jgi:TonB family protein
MAKTRSKPFDRFGNYVLFKKIDSDAFGELWRVGAIEGTQIGPLLALRKLTGDKSAMAGAISAASPLVGQATGAALVRNQKYVVVNGEPCITWEYGGGRSLRHIVDRAREAGHVPLPADQALAIAEKAAAGLDYVSSVTVDGKRILHGSLIPQFVWVYEDGDVRVAGQYLNSGLLTSLSNPDVAREIGPYVAPEIRGGGNPTRATEVYSIGAVLYLVITGEEPPDSASGTPIGIALSKATLMQSEEPLPADIRAILDKAMASDPAVRFPTAGDVKQAITDVLSAGNYAPTTFNLAFYLHNLLRKEMEGEAVEREKESKVNAEPYLKEIEEEKTAAAKPRPAAPPARAAAPAPVPVPAAPEPPEPPPLSAPALSASGETSSGKSKAPLIAAAVLVVAAGATGAWFMTQKKSEPQATVAQNAPAPPPATQTEPPPPEEQALEEPIVTEIPGVEDEAAPTDDAEAARKKAMEDEVNRRVQEEMRKLQEEYNRTLKQQQAASAAAASKPQASQPKPKEAEPVTQAATETAVASEPPAVSDSPAEPAETSTAAAEPPAQQAAPPPPPPPPPAVKEGDLIVSSEVDSLPTIARRVDPVYPPIAAKQRISALVIVAALVDEKGKVIDAKVLRGDNRNLGFDDASLKAIRKFTFQPAMKDGKKVKTWHSVPFIFGKQQ